MSKEEKTKVQIMQVLARKTAERISLENIDFAQLQEIRMRVGQPVILLYKGQEKILPVIGREEVRETLEYISNYSLYAYEYEMRQGFITIEGGHRVGVAGKIVMEAGRIKNLKYISSVNIRVAHEIKGCADKVFPYITADSQMLHTLIISPPRCGKTTILRDMIRQVSDGNRFVTGVSIGIVDERSEIGACYMGIPQNNLGMRTDILDCCPKAEGMMMLIRSMAPQVVAVDEIGAGEDVQAIEYAMHCGCKMLATAHGMSMEEIQKKPLFSKLINEKKFDRYIVLCNENHTGEIAGIYDEQGRLLYRENP